MMIGLVTGEEELRRLCVMIAEEKAIVRSDSRAISPWPIGPRTLGPRTLSP